MMPGFGVVSSFLCALVGVNAPSTWDDEESLSEATRKVVGTVLRQELAEELVQLNEKGDLRHEESEKVKVGPLKLGAKVSVDATFDDPTGNLELEVTRLVRTAPKTLRGTIVSSCPGRGNLRGEVVSLLSISTDFTAKARIEVDCEVTMVRDGEKIRYRPRILGSKLSVADVEFSEGIADLLSGLAERTANSLLEANRAKLEARANDALREAFESGKLRSSDDVILDVD